MMKNVAMHICGMTRGCLVGGKILMPILLMLVIMCSCRAPKRIYYLQNATEGKMIAIGSNQPVTLYEGDQLTITVYSSDDELANTFNLERSTSRSTSRYTVDSNGHIDFPTLGLIKVASMTREEVANLVKFRLIASQMIADPVVIVEFHNLGISVLGEVNHPGWIQMDKDRMTILEAIAKAGDLTINGQRHNVLVMRKLADTEQPYYIDLTDVNSVYRSDAYYLQSGDVVYVRPNATRANQSTPNGNASRTPTFWITIASFAVTLTLLFLK